MKRAAPLVVLAALLATAWSVRSIQAAGEPVKIGVIAPFSGAAAAWGQFSLRGAKLAAKQINDAGGVDGHKLELFQGDEACVPATAVTTALRLINENRVQVILGAVCSSSTLALMPVAEQNKVILLNGTSSNPKITYQAGVGGNRWTFRNLGTDETRAGVTLKWAVEQQKRKKFVALAVDNDFGRDAVRFVKKYVPTYPGVSLVSEDYYANTETDFRSVLTKIKAAGVDGIVFFGLVGTVPIICNQMNELGMGGGKFPLIGSGQYSSPDVLKKCPPGVLDNSVEGLSWMSTIDHPDNKQFIADYQAMWGGETPDATAYDNWHTLKILADAIKAAGSLENDKIITALEKGSFKTPLGDIKFDDHHQSNIPMIVVEIVNGVPTQRGMVRAQIIYPK